MVVLWIPLPFDVPVLDRANDVRFINLAKLDLDFVPSIRLRVLAEQVESACLWLNPFAITQDDVA